MKFLPSLSRKLSSRIRPSMWFLSVVFFALFLIFILPEISDRSYKVTQTSDSPDDSFFYTPDKLYRVAEQQGESGRSYYIKERFSFDIIWPLVYWFFLTTSIIVLYQSTSKEKWQLLNLLPSFVVLFDYLENLSTSAVMFFYPSPSHLMGCTFLHLHQMGMHLCQFCPYHDWCSFAVHSNLQKNCV